MPEPIIERGPDGRLRSLTLGPVKVEPPSSKRASKWRVCPATGGDGWDTKPADANGIRKAAKELGFTREQVSDALRAGVANLAAPTDAPSDALKPAEFIISTWGDGETKKEGPKYSHVDPLLALDAACKGGREFIAWDDTAILCAIDVDSDINEYGAMGRYTDAEAIEAARLTGADRAWVTRSGGLRLIFVARDGLTAIERALVGLALGGLPWRVAVAQIEVKSETRRPPDSVHHGRRCTGEVVARASDGGDVPDAVRDGWLAENGMEVNGGPYEHDLCPIEPCATSGNPPVNANEKGIWCYRCHGVYGRGYRSYGSLVDHHGEETPPNELLLAARERVNLAHARLMLRTTWPLSLIKDARGSWVINAWRGLVRATLDEPDPKARASVIASCLNPSNAWVRSEGGLWMRDVTLAPIDVEKDALRAMPWTRGTPQRVTLARSSGPLAGFVPIRVYRGAVLRPDEVPPSVIPVVAPRSGRPIMPIATMTEAAALAILAADYPGVSGPYLKALLCGAVCCEPGGRPILLMAHGPSGAAKSNTIKVAAGLLGSEVGSIEFAHDDEPRFRRDMGTALASGARFVLLDEMENVSAMGRRMRRLLALSDPFSFTPHYSSLTSVPCRSMIVLTGLDVPEAFRTSPELGRRMRVIRLATKVPRDWMESPPFDAWRDYDADGLAKERAEAGDSLVAHWFEFARERGFVWDRVGMDLNLPKCNEEDVGEAAAVTGALRALYRHLRGDNGTRVMSERSAYPGHRGWVNLSSEPAQFTLQPLLRGGEHARFLATKTLNAADWQTVLGIADVRVEAREQGGTWVARAVGRGGRGAAVNGDLPELPAM